ncbi:helix-turn-helix domain-containing protein [Euzebyella saccharophila]|uniref:Helix-turn-helix domain-containing protein n=1 Tax=Euzebyella saccharophila TaxID=679664 RepID=A0ABV8JKL8_9FLAO|nr:helix-turn-helix domain-containing protein [Euzebyella saccharophila]
MSIRFDEHRKDLEPYGLTCELFQPQVMAKQERHNELEINFLPDCSLTYLIGNNEYQIPKGSIVAFWGLMPHQVVNYLGEDPYFVVTVPFSILDEWKLPKDFLDAMFDGEFISIAAPKDIKFEKKRFKKWSKELKQNESQLSSACSLEIGAYIKRFALQSFSSEINLKNTQPADINLVERMAMFIAANFTDSIRVSHVAKEVGLHPDYANSIFKKAFRKTISDYIITQRISFAERKLTVSNDSITSVAYQSGFNSICRFNVAFKKKNKLTPREYRKKHLLVKLAS